MAFANGALARQTVGAASAAGIANITHLFIYRTADTRATLEAAGYFNSARNRLTVGDVILAVMATGSTPVVKMYRVITVPAAGSDVVISADGSGITPVDVTGSTLTVTSAAHAGRTVTLSRAAGIAVTLPAATGTGDRYRFFIGTTVTSNSTTIKVANATDVMAGQALVAQDGGDTLVAFEAAAADDTITFNGTTTGGLKGALVEIEDVASGLFQVRVTGAATGTEATPFSATVS